MVYNVIIIGAGLAGLTAAQHLTKQGYSVLLLEARNRLGGRIHTLTSEKETIELGAVYLYGRGSAKNPNPLIPLFQKFNLKSIAVDPLLSDTFDTAARRCSLTELFQQFQPYFEEANRKIQAAKRRRWQTFPSLAKVLSYEHPVLPLDAPEYWARKLITATIMHHTGAPLEEISLLELMHQKEYGGSPEIIVNGYQKITQGLFEQSYSTGHLTFNLNAAVQEIYHDPLAKWARVVTQDGKEHKGTTVIVAVPAGILKKGNIRFFPPLCKEKQQAIQHIKIAAQNMVILEFEKPFWPENIHYIYPNDPNPNFWPEYINLLAFLPHPKPILMANFYGPNAYGRRQKTEWVERSLNPLYKIYGKKIPKPLRTLVSHWDADPCALGRSAYYGVNCTEEDLDNLSTSQGRLYFAGDYTQRGSSAALNAAYTSGLRAALEIGVYLNYQTEKQFSLKR